MYTIFFFWRVLVICHCKSRTAVFVFNSITFSSLWYQYCRVISLNSLLTSFRSSTWCSFHVESQSPLHIITWSNLKNQLQLKPGIRLLIKVINSITNLFWAIHCGRKCPRPQKTNFVCPCPTWICWNHFTIFMEQLMFVLVIDWTVCSCNFFVQRWQKWMSRY